MELWWPEKVSLPGSGLQHVGFVGRVRFRGPILAFAFFSTDRSQKMTTLEADVPTLDSLQRDRSLVREPEGAGDPPISQKRRVYNISGSIYATKC